MKDKCESGKKKIENAWSMRECFKELPYSQSNRIRYCIHEIWTGGDRVCHDPMGINMMHLKSNRLLWRQSQLNIPENTTKEKLYRS